MGQQAQTYVARRVEEKIDHKLGVHGSLDAEHLLDELIKSPFPPLRVTQGRRLGQQRMQSWERK